MCAKSIHVFRISFNYLANRTVGIKKITREKFVFNEFSPNLLILLNLTKKNVVENLFSVIFLFASAANVDTNNIYWAFIYRWYTRYSQKNISQTHTSYVRLCAIRIQR